MSGTVKDEPFADWGRFGSLYPLISEKNGGGPRGDGHRAAAGAAARQGARHVDGGADPCFVAGQQHALGGNVCFQLGACGIIVVDNQQAGLDGVTAVRVGADFEGLRFEGCSVAGMFDLCSQPVDER